MKTFSSISLQNVDDGSTGPQGASVASSVYEYCVGTSSTSLPDNPTWSTEKPKLENGQYLWGRIKTTLDDGTVLYSNAICDYTISGIISDVDRTHQAIVDKVWSSDIQNEINSYDGTTTQAIRDRVSKTETDISGITSTVSDISSTVDSQGTRLSAAETTIEQTANNVLIKATKSDTTAAQGGQHLIESLINVAPSGVTISADKVAIEGAAIFTSGRLSESSLNNAYDAKGAAATVQENLDNLSVGGRNLIRCSLPINDQGNTYWDAPTNHDFTTEDGFPCIHFTGALSTSKATTPTFTMQTSSNVHRHIPSPDQTFTLSADVKFVNVVKGTTNYFVALYASGATINGNWRAPIKKNDGKHFLGASTSEILDPDKLNGQGWTRVYMTVTYSDAYEWPEIIPLQVYARDFTGDVYFKNIKLEEGNVPTAWTPAPEDTQANIEAVQSNLDNISVSGRNLFKDSGALGASWTKDNGTVSNGIVTLDTSKSGNIRIYQMPANGYWTWEANTDYVMSIDAKASAAGAKMRFSAVGIGYDTPQMDLTTEWKRYSAVVKGSTASTGSASFFAINTGGNQTVQFRHPKLEKGNKPTDWSPAPEEIITSTLTCYYRSTTSTTPTITTSTTIGTSNSTDNAWEYVMPIPKRNAYFFTCEKYTYADGSVSFSTVRPLDSQTYASKWVSSNDSTCIDGGSIYAHSITASQLSTDAIKSNNYIAANSGPYSSAGTFLDLSNGNIYTPNFGVQSTTGQAFLNGEIIATSGSIGDDSGNYWEIGNTIDSQGNGSASIVGNGTAFIQDGDWQIHSGLSNYSNGSINTQWYATQPNAGLKLTHPYYDGYYYDYGMTSPVLDSTSSRFYNSTVSQNFLYIRKHANTIPSLESDWNYIFRVDKDGMVWINGTSLTQMISDGVDGGAYVPTSGGTITGNLTVNGTLTATATKANALSSTGTIRVNLGSTSTATYTSGGNITPGVTGTLGAGNGGTGQTSLNASMNALINSLSVGTSTSLNDNVKIITQDTATANNTYYLRPASTIWEYIKTKLSSDPSSLNSLFVQKSGDTVTGSLTVENGINSDSAQFGDLVVTGAGRFTNGLYGNLIGNADTATTAAKVADSQNGNATTFAYSKTGLTTASWLAAWNNYELRAISPANVLSTIGAVAKSGDTMTGNLTVSNTSPLITVKNSGTGSAGLVLERTGTSSADWKIINTAGSLKIQNDYTTTVGDYFDVLTLAYNTGNATFKGTVTASSFKGNADTATSAGKLTSPVNITVGGKTNSFDGSTAISFSKTDISSNASTSAAGWMSSDDKTKLNGIESGAQVNTITGVKGNSESSYRTGNVNITASNIGLGNLTNNKQVKGLSSGTTSGHLVTWGSDGYTVADSGISKGNIVKSVASNSDGQLVLTYADDTTSSPIDVEFVATQASSVQKADSLNVNGTAVGSATEPVYFDNQGKPQKANTIPKLNNTTTGGAFYAPTSAGTNGQILKSSGGTPGWVNQSTLSVGSATTAGAFSSNASVTLTGDTTGTASSTKGWSIATTTNTITATPTSTLNSQEAIDGFLTANKLQYGMFKTTDANNVGFGSNDGMIISMSWSSTNYGTQIALDDVASGAMKFRGKAGASNGWGDWRTVLHDGNYNSYSPTLTGTGASGTWGISISGNAATATKATQDGSGNTITSTYVKKTGDTMTGTLTIKPSTTIATNTPATIEFQVVQTDNNITTNGNFIKVYDDHDAANYGGNMVIQSASGLVIGAGESPSGYYTNVMKDANSELLTLISDGNIHIFTNANTVANRKGITIDKDLNFYPQTTETGSLGTSSYKWADVYATNLHGELDGNAATATFAEKATADASGNTITSYYCTLSTNQTISGTKTFSAMPVASAGISVGTSAGTSGGVSLYSDKTVDFYGLAFRTTANSGKHGFVQGDWATYSFMYGNTNEIMQSRGWIFRDRLNSKGVASISGAGHAVFNGSVTVGGNTTNSSGCRAEFNETTQSLDFIFN